jgi:hypothetical protein
MSGAIQGYITTIYNGSLNADQRHLLTCVKTVLSRHLTPGQPLLLSLPADGHKFTHASPDTNHLLDVGVQVINEKILWPVRVTRPDNKTLPTSLDTESNFYTYIIFTCPVQGESNANGNLMSQVEELKAKGLINNRGRFFIVVTTVSEFPRQVAFPAIEGFWNNYSILDVLIMVPVSSPVPQSDIKHHEETSSFHFYSRFPFHASGNDVVLIDEWRFDTNGKPFPASGLFLSKIPKKFQNHNTLTVLTAEIEPTIVLAGNTTDENNKTILQFRGSEIDLLIIVLKQLNLSLVYSNLSSNITTISLGLLTDLLTSNLDLIVGSLPLHENLTSHGDPTITYFSTDFKWYLPCPKPIPRLVKIAGIYHSSLWLLCCFAIVTMAIALWLLAKSPNSNELNVYRTFSNCLYIVWAVVSGVSTFQPTTSSLRTLFFLWVCYSYAMSTVFLTFLTSFLVHPGFEKRIESYEEILKSGLEYGYDNIFDTFFRRFFRLEDSGIGSTSYKLFRFQNVS